MPCVALIPLPDFISLPSASQFDTPRQLGLASSPPLGMAQVFTFPVCAEDILVLEPSRMPQKVFLQGRVVELVNRLTHMTQRECARSGLPHRARLHHAGYHSAHLRAQNVTAPLQDDLGCGSFRNDFGGGKQASSWAEGTRRRTTVQRWRKAEW